MSDKKIDFVESKYLDYINKNRFYICIALGVIFRFFVLLNITIQIASYFGAIFITYRIFTYILLKDYPINSYAANILHFAGLNELLVKNIGRILDMTREFFVDLIFLMFSYLCTHIITKLVL